MAVPNKKKTESGVRYKMPGSCAASCTFLEIALAFSDTMLWDLKSRGSTALSMAQHGIEIGNKSDTNNASGATSNF